MMNEKTKSEWLAEYQGFKKYIHQCVACQNQGYDPEEIKSKEGKYFQQIIRNNFPIVLLNSTGICETCEIHIKA